MSLRSTILIASLAAAVWPAQALAQLRFCNRTGVKVSVAIAYSEKDAPGTTTNQHRGVTAKGWYSFEPGECAQVSGIHVGNHWAYFYAHGSGKVWEGSAKLCVPGRGFTKGVRFLSGGEVCGDGDRLRGFRRMTANTRGYTMNLH
jgi:uncharacterized membrane protein